MFVLPYTCLFNVGLFNVIDFFCLFLFLENLDDPRHESSNAVAPLVVTLLHSVVVYRHSFWNEMSKRNYLCLIIFGTKLFFENNRPLKVYMNAKYFFLFSFILFLFVLIGFYLFNTQYLCTSKSVLQNGKCDKQANEQTNRQTKI